MRKKPKLPPHQYRLRLSVPQPAPVPQPPRAHLVFYGGQWHLFRNRWKSRWREPPCLARNITGNTIAEVKHRLAKASDRSSFSFRPP